MRAREGETMLLINSWPVAGVEIRAKSFLDAWDMGSDRKAGA